MLFTPPEEFDNPSYSKQAKETRRIPLFGIHDISLASYKQSATDGSPPILRSPSLACGVKLPTNLPPAKAEQRYCATWHGYPLSSLTLFGAIIYSFDFFIASPGVRYLPVNALYGGDDDIILRGRTFCRRAWGDTAS